jgi:hypothetical protein
MGIGSADAVSLRISTDTEQTSSNLDKVINRLDKTIDLLSKISSSDSFKKKNSDIKDTEKSTEKLNNSLGKIDKTLSKIDKSSSWTGFRSLLSSIKDFSKQSYKWIEASAGYAENLNLMQVAFKETGEELNRTNESIVNGLSDAFGLDESVMTRQLGYYRQIGNALNIDAKYADTLAHNLLKMQLDMSSLYNLSFEKSGEVLQSSMAGQTKPIRGATGADITQATLQTDLDRMNIDASITDLSRAEKVLLIYLSIQNQIVASQGDLAKTINSTANQQKILAEQSSRLGRAIGDLLNPVFGKLLAILNGVIMATTELIMLFAKFVGIEMPIYETGTGDIDWVEDLSDSLGDSEEKAKSLKKSLRGFDKLNVINTPNKDSGGSGASLSGAGIMSELYSQLDEYDLKMQNMSNKATEIRDRIMEWLGFSKQVNEETGEIEWKFEKLTSGTVLGALGVGGFILVGASKVYKMLKNIGLLKFTGITKLGALFKSVGTFISNTSAYETLAGYIDDIAIGFGGWAKGMWSFSEAWSLVGTALGKLTFVVALVTAVVNVIKTIPDWLKKIKEFLEKPSWETYFEACEAGFKASSPLASGFLKILDKIGINTETVSDKFEKMTDKIEEVTKPVGDWFNKYFIEPMKKIGEGAKENFGIIFDKISEITGKLDEVKKAWAGWFNEIKEKFFDKIKTKFDEFKGWVSGVGEKFKNFYDTYIKDSFVGKIIEGLKSIKTWFEEKFVPAFGKKFSEWIKVPINKVFESIEDKVNTLIKAINKIIKLTNSVTGSDIKSVKEIKIPKLYTGGMPEDGWFRASKGELMGKFDDGTSIVANNRQVVAGVREMLKDGIMDALVMANNSGGNKTTTQVTIVAEDNDLLNGIKFKEKQRDRQFGY